jgi:hypothetical protein
LGPGTVDPKDVLAFLDLQEPQGGADDLAVVLVASRSDAAGDEPLEFWCQ